MSFEQLSIFIFLLSLLVPPQLSEADANEFSECSQREYYCGGQQYHIYYPFRLPDSPEFCGHPDFEVACNDGNTTLLINFKGKDFTVNNIDYSNQLIQVTDPSFYASCPRNFANYTLDLSIAKYSSQDMNLTVFVNCSTTMTKFHNLRNISCLASEAGYNSFYSLPREKWVPPLEVWDKCQSVAKIPIYQATETYLNSSAVSLKLVLQAGFSLEWQVGKGCMECTVSGGICRFSKNAPLLETCYCSDATSVGSICVRDSDSAPKVSRMKKWRMTTLAATLGGAAAFIAVCCFVCWRRRKQRQYLSELVHDNLNISKMRQNNLNTHQNVEAFLQNYASLAPKRYKYSDVKKIAESFRNKLGQGGYGSVFKGSLGNGPLVAVKVLNNSKGNGDDFVNEIASIGGSSHVNIVNLLGFCSEGSKRALIYEYMCNRSLDKLICSEEPKTTADWEKLYRIATGIARGLEYLHRGCNTRIVHFDIKPHNILLDEDFCPKISDFGLAKLCIRKDSILSMEGTRGTIGYIAPEVFSRNFGVISSKSDIYSYGMMLLEMVGGRKNVTLSVENTSETYFPHSIYKHMEQNSNLQAYGATAETEEVVRKMILVGLWCIQVSPQNRPSITRVIEMLEGSISDLQLPPRPNLSFPSPLRSLLDDSSIQDGTCSGLSTSAIH